MLKFHYLKTQLCSSTWSLEKLFVNQMFSLIYSCLKKHSFSVSNSCPKYFCFSFWTISQVFHLHWSCRWSKVGIRSKSLKFYNDWKAARMKPSSYGQRFFFPFLKSSNKFLVTKKYFQSFRNKVFHKVACIFLRHFSRQMNLIVIDEHKIIIRNLQKTK